jgi:hypothetical protein
MDGTRSDIAEGWKSRFDRWATVAGLAYFAAMAVPAASLKGSGLGALWFRTAMPVTFAAGAALAWLLWPAPRPSWRAFGRTLVEVARRRPGKTIFYLGAFLVIEGWVLTAPLSWPAAESSLRLPELAIVATAVVAVIGGFVTRRVFPAQR